MCVLFSNWEKWRKNSLHDFGLDQLDLLGLIALALVAFGFCLRDLYEQWYIRKVRKEVRDDVREICDLTQRLRKRNRALKQGKCRRRFKVSLAVVPPPTSPSPPELLRMTLKGGVPRRAFATSKTPAA